MPMTRWKCVDKDCQFQVWRIDTVSEENTARVDFIHFDHDKDELCFSPITRCISDLSRRTSWYSGDPVAPGRIKSKIPKSKRVQKRGKAPWLALRKDGAKT